jgi:hypothetical protein
MTRVHETAARAAELSPARAAALPPAAQVRGVLGSSGRPLDPSVRAFMEPRLGHSFSNVRVHADALSAASARAVRARAYTTGRDIVFGAGQYSPGTEHGRLLLAHELAHVVQQALGPVDGTPTSDGIEVSDPSDRFEREAHGVAGRVVGERRSLSVWRPGRDGRPTSVVSPASATAPILLQREKDHGVRPGRAATSAVFSGTLTLASGDVLTYRVQLRNAPSMMSPPNQRAIDLECQAGVRAALLAEGKATARPRGPTSLDLRLDVEPARLLKKGYVAALVGAAALAEMRLTVTSAAKPTVVNSKSGLAQALATGSPVLAELADEVRATFVAPLRAELVRVVNDEAARQAAIARTSAAADAETVRKPRAWFRWRHRGHGEHVLNNIDRALEEITKDNVQLRVAFYEYYADSKLTDELDPEGIDLAETDAGDTALKKDLLALQMPDKATDDRLSLLGGTLIHEFVHTSQRGLRIHEPDEAKAYGVEYFLVQRIGKDPKRLGIIETKIQRLGVHGLFMKARRTMEALYAVIDRSAGSRSPTQAKLTREGARALVAEFVSTDEGRYGATLTALIEEASE